MILVAVILRITTGRHIIFSHTRVGRGGRDFQCFKFRSMVANSDELLAELLANDPEARAEWERDFKLKNDPRITRFGRFIRRTSLDEFPQIWNVVRGDMSIVGPRPVVRKELDLYYADALQHYLAVKPGLTGMWQISGRNDMEYAERVALDRAYVENWGLWSDSMIVMRTAVAIFRRSGAY
jgi:lipopolysaccharide/colanic/teichoic acid biosynthesis glycosyltransferase